jgi:hypothetical protein
VGASPLKVFFGGPLVGSSAADTQISLKTRVQLTSKHSASPKSADFRWIFADFVCHIVVDLHKAITWKKSKKIAKFRIPVGPDWTLRS